MSVSGVDRFVVWVEYPSGPGPRELTREDALADALAARDAEIASHLAEGFDGSEFSVTVTDSDRPGSRPLGWEDERRGYDPDA